MVLVSHIYRFIYIKNVKVASSSVESFFGQFCIDPAKKADYTFSDGTPLKQSEYGIIGNRIVVSNENWYQHMPASRIKQVIGDKIFNSYFKFCVVRNPWDLVVSMFHFFRPRSGFKVYCMKYFKETGDSANLKRTSSDGKQICDFYIRYERLKEDIAAVCEKLGIPPSEYNIDMLPNHKSNSRPKDKPYQEYYDDETREHIRRAFKNDIEMFGYTF